MLDSKEKGTRHVGAPTKETDLADRHDHRIGAKQIYYHTYLQSFALFVEQTQFPLNLEWARMLFPNKLKLKVIPHICIAHPYCA